MTDTYRDKKPERRTGMTWEGSWSLMRCVAIVESRTEIVRTIGLTKPTGPITPAGRSFSPLAARVLAKRSKLVTRAKQIAEKKYPSALVELIQKVSTYLATP